MYRGARVRTRGGRGRGFIVNNITNDYKRSDQNYFEVLSGLPDNGDDELPGELHMNSWGSENEGFTTVRKRQRVSTGGKSNAPETSRDIDSELLISEFEKMSIDEKLSAIFTSLSSNQNKIMHVEQKVDTIIRINNRLSRVETVMTSYNDRMKLLEYRSIDIEARSRRNNLLFKGFPEARDEDCRRVISRFLEDKLSIDELPSIERAHRLGRFNPRKGPRPIIVAFSFFRDTEDILSQARSLKGTPFGISRDYPPEITRQELWPRFKEAREDRFNRVTIGYPAKLIVNGAIICDLFPDWDAVMKGSRIPVPRYASAQTRLQDSRTQDNISRPTSYAAAAADCPIINTRQCDSQEKEAATNITSPNNSFELMETQDVISSQRSPSLLADSAAGNKSDIYCETNFDTNLTNQCEPKGPHSNDEKNQHDSQITKNPTDRSELSPLSADNRSKAPLPQNGVNNDCAAPNCNIEAAGLLKEPVKQHSNSNTYQCVSQIRDRAASDLSLSPRSVADTLIRSSRAKNTDVEPGLQDLRSKQASSRRHAAKLAMWAETVDRKVEHDHWAVLTRS